MNSFSLYAGRCVFGASEFSNRRASITENNFFSFYSDGFNSICLDSTEFCSIGSSRIRHWLQQIGEKDFQFIMHSHPAMLHEISLRKGFHTSQAFADYLRQYEAHFGVVMLNLPAAYSTKRFSEIKQYCAQHPFPRIALLFQNKNWYHATLLNNLSPAITTARSTMVFDDDGNLDVASFSHLEFRFLMVRFHVLNSAADLSRLQNWIRFISSQRPQKLSSCYFLFVGDEQRVAMLKIILWLRLNN